MSLREGKPIPASLEFQDTDGSTVITTYDAGSVPTPGSSANKKLYVHNNGDQTAQSLTVTIEQIGTNDGSNYALLALDSGGSPGSFGTAALSLGNLAAGAHIPFWYRTTLPSGVTSDNNPRRLKLVADAQTI